MKEIGRQTAGMAEAISLLDTIPGIDAVAARALVAEIGTNMDQFPTAKSLCFLGGTVSWE